MGAPPRNIYVIGEFVFVPSPTNGLWIRTHYSVAFVRCPICKAKKTKPCISNGYAWSGTHWPRRRDGKKFRPSRLDERTIIRIKP